MARIDLLIAGKLLKVSRITPGIDFSGKPRDGPFFRAKCLTGTSLTRKPSLTMRTVTSKLMRAVWIHGTSSTFRYASLRMSRNGQSMSRKNTSK